MFILGLIIGCIAGVLLMALIVGGKMGNFIYYEKIEDYEKQFKKAKERDFYKSIIDEIRECIESKNNGVCVKNGVEKPAYTFLLDFNKAREFVWDLLQILDKVKELEEGNND